MNSITPLVELQKNEIIKKIVSELSKIGVKDDDSIKVQANSQGVIFSLSVKDKFYLVELYGDIYKIK